MDPAYRYDRRNDRMLPLRNYMVLPGCRLHFQSCSRSLRNPIHPGRPGKNDHRHDHRTDDKEKNTVIFRILTGAVFRQPLFPTNQAKSQQIDNRKDINNAFSVLGINTGNSRITGNTLHNNDFHSRFTCSTEKISGTACDIETLFLILRCFSCCICESICIAPKFSKNNTVFLCLTDIYSFLNKYNCLLKLQTQRVKKETPEIFRHPFRIFHLIFSSASRIRMPGYLLLQLPSPVR